MDMFFRVVIHRFRKRSVHGQAAVEMAAFAPIVVVVVLVLMQGITAVVAASQIRDAARDGARAAERGDSVNRAVHSSLPSWIDLDSIGSCGRGCVRVSAQMPIGIPGYMEVSHVTISDTATFRLRGEAAWH